MNERIKQLAVEAGFYANPDIEKFEKFAQLIVAECIDAVIEAQADFYMIHNIKSRFGIEE